MWDFTQYNQIVKHVEQSSGRLRSVALAMSPHRCQERGGGNLVTYRSRTAERLQGHLLRAAEDLDKRALRMLAIYDPAARQMVKDGVTYDPRRGPKETDTPVLVGRSTPKRSRTKKPEAKE